MTRSPVFQRIRTEERETGGSPSQAGKEVRELTAVAEAVDGVGAALDPRHDPGDEKDQEELHGLADEQEAWRGHCVRDGLRGLWSSRVESVADEVYAEGHGSEESDEDE